MDNKKKIVDVSVILPTYNRNEVLKQTLEYLLEQDPAPREIIVVDQSKEHNKATNGFIEKLIASGQIVYIFQQEPNAQRARNRAIVEARGEVLLFIDDDMVMDSNLVGAHWKNYEDTDLAAVCGFYLEPNEQPLDELPNEFHRPFTGWIYMPHCYTKRIESYQWPSGNGSIRRDVAIRLGGFDENYIYAHFDDTDLSCRLKQLGLKVIHDPEAKLIHLKERIGGKRPGSLNEFVIADSNTWYTWCYFFWLNFGWKSWKELTIRLRRCVFRRKNITRPWFLVLSFIHFMLGAFRAGSTMIRGRKLGFGEAQSSEHSSIRNNFQHTKN